VEVTGQISNFGVRGKIMSLHERLSTLSELDVELVSSCVQLQPRKPSRRLSPAETASVLDAYQTGESVPLIALRHHINQSTVFRLIGRNQIRRRYPKLSPEDIKLLSELYALGATTEELASQYEVHVTTIRREFRKAGIRFRSSRARRPMRGTRT